MCDVSIGAVPFFPHMGAAELHVKMFSAGLFNFNKLALGYLILQFSILFVFILVYFLKALYMVIMFN